MTINKRLLFVLFAFSILIFQNCSMQNTASSSIASGEKAGGNGGGYDGKPDGTFYFFVPGFKCDERESATQIVVIQDGKAEKIKQDGSVCSKSSVRLNPSDILVSPFQKTFIGVQDELYKRYETEPSEIPDQIAEILCRDDFENPTFEIVSHYDRNLNKALIQVFSFSGNSEQISTSRVLSSKSIRYVSSNLSLQVDITNPDPANLKFKGQVLSSKTEFVSVNQNLTCIKGGSISTNDWKLNKVSDQTISKFNVLANDVVFSTPINSFNSKMMRMDRSGVVDEFPKRFLGDGYATGERFILNTPNVIVLSAKRSTDNFKSWYAFDRVRDQMVRITNLPTSSNVTGGSFIRSAPVVTSNDILVYEEFSLGTPSTSIIRSLDLESQKIQDIYQGTNDVAYRVLPSSNKVLMLDLVEGRVKSVRLYDLVLKSFKNLSNDFFTSCSPMIDLDFLMPSENEKAVSLSLNCNGQNQVGLLSLEDGSYTPVGQNQTLKWMSNPLQWLLTINDLGKFWIFDLKKDTQTDLQGIRLLPNESGISNSRNVNWPARLQIVDRWLYSFGEDAVNPKLYRVDLQNGTSVSACESVPGRKVYLGRYDDQKLYLFTYDPELSIYYFYKILEDGSCDRINEFPSAYAFVHELKVTSVGFALTLSYGSSRPTQEIVVVPVDGRPPLRVNPHDGENWHLGVLRDNNRMIFTGPDANGISKLFSFDLK